MGMSDADQKSPVHPPPATGIPMTTATGIPMTTPTAPPIFQPLPHQLQPQGNGQWSVGLCDCFFDCARCCISCCCPCITLGQISEILDKASSRLQGNVDRQSRGVAMSQMPPVMEGGMRR